MRIKHMFEDTHQAMLELDARVMNVPFLASNTYYLRHPDDINQVLSRDGSLFVKSQRVAQCKEWLGTGIFSQLDYKQHAAMRQTLNPAFRMDYLRQLDTIFVGSALQLAALLQDAATAAAAGGSTGSSAGLDMQRMFRLMALDSIGLTSMHHELNAMRSWQQHLSGAGSEAASSSSSSSATRSSSGVDVEQMLSDLSAAFIWQSLLLPVPRSWLPGWKEYITACGQLDSIIQELLAQRRAADSSASSSSSSSSASSSSTGLSVSAAAAAKEDIVGFLLLAQRQQGPDVITDAQIGDEIKTMMFGGSDTSSFTLAMLAYHLAANPGAAERAAGEVQALLQSKAGTGSGGVEQLRAEDASRLPFVSACVNETLRLHPAGPTITRTATQDVEIAGYRIAKGQSVVCNVWSMQRHEAVWQQPDAWLPERWMPDGAAAGLAPKAKNAFLPFSTGSRSCIGRNYAMLQMVLTVAVLLGQGVRFGQLPGAKEPQLQKNMTMVASDGVWLNGV